MPVDGNNLHAKDFLPAVRDAVLKEKDYHKADELCRKMQGLFAEAYQGRQPARGFVSAGR